MLGTKFTMEEGFYRDRLQANCGIEGLIPDAGARAVILRSTETELLITATDSDVPVYASTSLHAKAAVDRALRE